MEKFSFFNDVDGDRVYYAEDFARHLATYFTNGIFNNGCQVLADNDNMFVNVSIGSANINGYRYDNDAIKTLIVDNADGVLNRIDNVVIRWNLTERTITAMVVKGAFAENPIAPDLVRTSTTYDLRIAKISVPAGTTEITQNLVTDTRFITSDCGNVISTVQTPDTEQLFIQIQAIFDNTIDTMTGDFDTWFEHVKGQLSTDVAGHLQNEIDAITPNVDQLLDDVAEIQANILDFELSRTIE
nr:MAG TPA: Receptor Binding Protein [Caudoviricetes sp.]